MGLFCALLLFNGVGNAQDQPQGVSKQSYDVAAFYWPDYHYDRRLAFIFSDGKGEWQTIYNAKARDAAERQPRVPLWGYEDEASPKVMDKKIEAATSHGVNVFIFDWYWYANQPLLEACLDSGFLVANHNRMKFYIMWANHDATSYWDPDNPDKGKVYWTGQVDTAVFHTIVHRVITHYFTRPSYYKIDGKPVFSLYELSNFIKGMGGVAQARKALDYFRAATRAAGFPGLYLQGILWSAIPDQLETETGTLRGQSAVLAYFGFNSFTNYTWAHVQNPDGAYAKWAEGATAHWQDYARFGLPYHPHVSIGWDPNPRFPFNVGFVQEGTPQLFKKYLLKAKQYLQHHPEQPRLITINAWNEWSEGSYLEPDTLYGMQYLQAVQSVFGQP